MAPDLTRRLRAQVGVFHDLRALYRAVQETVGEAPDAHPINQRRVRNSVYGFVRPKLAMCHHQTSVKPYREPGLGGALGRGFKAEDPLGGRFFR